MSIDGREDEHLTCGHANEVAALRRELADHKRALAALRDEVAELKAHATMAASDGPPPDSRPERRWLPAPPTAAPASQAQLAGERRLAHVDQRSSRDAKLALYRELFAGRDDVYARRWENRAKGTSGWAPAHVGTWRTPREEREYLPLTDEVVTCHLEGRETIGLYPLRSDDTCGLLAVDFDGAAWRLDAQAYVDAADAVGVPTAVELSRSGDGAHVWTFFTAPVAATQARALGAALLREAMALRGELDLDSYDRLFPSQDYLPERGFGNLIALPLQGECRRDRRTTVFVDPRTFEPWEDQFAFLRSVPRITLARVRQAIDDLRPVIVGPDTGLHVSSLRPDPSPPGTIEARLGGMLAIRRAGIPPGLYASLKHLATLHGPAFHKNENLRLSNHATPRFIRCYVEDLEHLYLPRGLTEQAAAIIEEAGSRLAVTDERSDPAPIDVEFRGVLRDEQAQAVRRMVEHDLGILEAPPGAGKTVIGCVLIAHHRTPTLVVVDRKPLLAQWRDRLRAFLGIEAGQIGGGKKRPSNTVDIAMIQTITRSDDASELLEGYGLVVVDECHHVPAPTVERAIRSLDARRWVGLTATPHRPDGLKEIMIMQCGPIRHRIQRTTEDLPRILNVHRTRVEVNVSTEGLSRGEMLALVNAAVVEDVERTDQICHDVASAMSDARNCLVLSSRTEHVDLLADALRSHGLEPLILYGSMKPKERRAVHEELGEDGQLLLVATDRYIGEGFDCPRLDTLFLAFPVSAPQRIIQYVGRILRNHPDKTTAEVHDYLDEQVPVLAAMYRRRLPGYRQLGFSPQQAAAAATPVRLWPHPGQAQPSEGPRRTSAVAREPTAAQVRAWAREAGYAIPSRGRISSEIWQAYQDTHG